MKYVDGRPRYQGVQTFLKSRGIKIAFGTPEDPPEKETVCGIGNRKNNVFHEVLKQQGVEVFTATVELIKALKKAGVRIGVASSSKNCRIILESAGIAELFETRVDGLVSAELGLKGKPEGDIFVTATRNLDSVPPRAVIVEDANSGVQAGRNGGFGLVIGVARKNNGVFLLKNGADVVIQDLKDITPEWMEKWFHKEPVPLFEYWEKTPEKNSQLTLAAEGKNPIKLNPFNLRAVKSIFYGKRKPVFFLDYDGTLTPIVDRPDLAVISPEMKDAVTRLSKIYTVAIVSGRMREDVENLVGIGGLFYAGSHGFDIRGPGFSMVEPVAEKTIPVISEIIGRLKKRVGDIPGALVEEKKFSTAVHYRLVEEKYWPQISDAVSEVIHEYHEVRLMSGKMVFEILPKIEWDKGKAIRWMMNAFKMSWSKSAVCYIGDDTTDEFAFRTVRTRGTGILVAQEPRPSAADFCLATPSDVEKFFNQLLITAS